jgi:hypothetical protein
MRIKPLLFCGFLLSTVSAQIARTQPAGSGQPATDQQTPDQDPTADESGPSREARRAGPRAPSVDLLRLLDVQASHQDERPAPIDGYVRFYVCDPSQCGVVEPVQRGSREYGDDHRDWFSRWLMGRSYSRILTVKLTVTRPNFTVTTTLASSGFQSNSTVGETWNSEVSGRTYLTPYVRVDAETLVRVHVSLDASSRVQSNVSRTVLDVLGRAANLIQPGSQLVTSLNSSRFSDTSEFIDRSISALFAQNLAERSTNEFDPSDWSGKPMVDIEVQFPMNRNALRSESYRNVGQWRFMATAPRISIFSDTRMDMPGDIEPHCPDASGSLATCNAFRGVTPQRILGFGVGENLTLGRVLAADSEITAELGRLMTASGDARQTSARRLCHLVASKAEEVGLNRFDAAAAVWAFAERSQLDRERRDLLLHRQNSCAAGAVAASTTIGG